MDSDLSDKYKGDRDVVVDAMNENDNTFRNTVHTHEDTDLSASIINGHTCSVELLTDIPHSTASQETNEEWIIVIDEASGAQDSLFGQMRAR